ncbi:guanine nucleotide-binding protein G(olf) subunit alpha [Procambarus clarkii]|uniref:guanine nucleotide-binding protein G(olf) subunit alpha n=1 Tax=Procambarus clarkii TaxID=6728 RepID=UPI001E6705D6|nr:guanine nucleotide-binding protein G(olf) subunit alpha-like isoform X2 [Procambarus clarkii]
MVFCGTNPERRQSRELEKKISSWMKEYKKAIKILLLGAGESGKTTIIKQMKILHISGFSPEEKTEKAQDIRSNILEGITTLTRNLDALGIRLGKEENQHARDYILDIDPEDFPFPEEFYDHTSRLWSDPGIQEVYSQQHRFQLIDCTKYFLDMVDVVRKPDYVPTIQDILHSRRRTTDIQKIEFEVKVPKKYGGGALNFWMFDVGGQRGERKKWIQVFDGIQAVLFLVSASCFDLVIREDELTNRLQESIDIFQSMWHSRFLKNSGFIVFLNKQDILRDKVVNRHKCIGDHFPEYTHYVLQSKDRDSEEDEEYLRTRCFIRDKFLAISRQVVKREGRRLAPGFKPLEEQESSRECYCHFTIATDTNNVRIVFEDVHNMIIMWNLHDIGVNVS